MAWNLGEFVERWAMRLGLANAPLFTATERSGWDRHHVFLDGGRGSFALSLPDGDDTSFDETRSWTWSCDLAHHVQVKRDSVIVSRWDDVRTPKTYALRRVEDRFEEFYRFLLLDRTTNTLNVIEHLLDLFRRVRSQLDHQNLPQDAAVDVFLLVLAGTAVPVDAIDEQFAERAINTMSVPRNHVDTLTKISPDAIRSLATHFGSARWLPLSIKLYPQLAIRHAGGSIFQEAHFEFLRGGSPDLLGLTPQSKLSPVSRGGAHFTPPALARLVVEECAQYLPKTNGVVLFDPACGSGAFLHEALRTLRRSGFSGNIKLIGRDTSPHAISMANFTLGWLVADWSSHGQCSLDIRIGNSLNEIGLWSEADLIIMNPPFIAWSAMNHDQRNDLSEILGSRLHGQPDYSMAFVERAASSAKAGAVIGTLLPASLFSMRASLPWRKSLLERVRPFLLASFGSHALFQHALVQVGVLIGQVGGRPQFEERFTTVWSDEKQSSASEVVRALRRTRPDRTDGQGEGWSFGQDVIGELAKLEDWRPRPGRLIHLLRKIRTVTTTEVADLFKVEQGILPGLRSVFVLSDDQLAELPAKERKYFKPVAEGRNIHNGRIIAAGFLFFPYGLAFSEVRSEDDLKALVPIYSREYLLPNKPELARRPAIVSRRGDHRNRWWELNRPRPNQEGAKPKIATAFFGRTGSFAWDRTGEYAVVQGHVWMPLNKLLKDADRLEAYSEAFLGAYTAILNSSVFSQLLREFCPQVSGGQYNLATRFVQNIPVPDLGERVRVDMQMTNLVQELELIGTNLTIGEPFESDRLDSIVAALYGTSRDEWQIP